MAKFLPDRFPPGFFDLPRTAGETLPLEVIAAWTASDQTADSARSILAPHALHGTIASSDSSGLTRMTRERPLVIILAMINHPKEFVHAFGRAIGGRPIGVWAADNTQMFYGADTALDRIVGMLVTTMSHIAKECELGIGMAVHTGEFFELGGSVYGPHADRVELIAEEHTSVGELVITDTVASLLPEQHGFGLVPRLGLPAGLGASFQVADGEGLTDIVAVDVAYPAPYSADFTAGLAEYSRTRRESRVPNAVYRDLTVVLIEREAEETRVTEVAVLNDLALTAAMKRLGRTLLRDHAGEEVKTAGRLGIFGFQDATIALSFAREFRRAFGEQGVRVRIGIDRGAVLLFDLAPGARDIAGSPVNVASKLAQDVGMFGSIRCTEAVMMSANEPRDGEARSIAVSGTELRTYDL